MGRFQSNDNHEMDGREMTLPGHNVYDKYYGCELCVMFLEAFQSSRGLQ